MHGNFSNNRGGGRGRNSRSGGRGSNRGGGRKSNRGGSRGGNRGGSRGGSRGRGRGRGGWSGPRLPFPSGLRKLGEVHHGEAVRCAAMTFAMPMHMYTGSRNSATVKVWAQEPGGAFGAPATVEMAAAGPAAGAIGSLVAASGVMVCGLAEELLGPSTRVGKVAGFGDPTLANTSRMAGFILDAKHAPFCHTRQVTVVRVLAERGLVITGSEDAAIHVWLFTAGAFTLAKRLEGHVRAIRSLLIATVAEATYLYSAGDDGMIKQWDMSAGREGSYIRTVNVRTEPNAHTLSVTCLAQYADASSGSIFVVSAGADRKLCVWNAADLAFVAGSDAYDAVTCLATVRSGAGDALIVLGCQSGTLAVKKFGATGIEDVGCVFTGARGHASGPIVAVMSGGDANFVSVSESGQMVFWTA